MASDYDAILIKQHPLEKNSKVQERLLKSLQNAALTAENVYKLLSHQNLVGVAALSSSCVYEASFFKKRQHVLLPDVTFDQSPLGHPTFDIGNDILVPDFWRSVLSAIGLDVTPKDGLEIQFKPNRFRLQHHTAWGYNQIDTDISVGWAK
mgnify:CR=1 FL=1